MISPYPPVHLDVALVVDAGGPGRRGHRRAARRRRGAAGIGPAVRRLHRRPGRRRTEVAGVRHGGRAADRTLTAADAAVRDAAGWRGCAAAAGRSGRPRCRMLRGSATWRQWPGPAARRVRWCRVVRCPAGRASPTGADQLGRVHQHGIRTPSRPTSPCSAGPPGNRRSGSRHGPIRRPGRSPDARWVRPADEGGDPLAGWQRAAARADVHAPVAFVTWTIPEPPAIRLGGQHPLLPRCQAGATITGFGSWSARTADATMSPCP